LNLGPIEALRVFLEQQLRWLSLEEVRRELDQFSALRWLILG
jgi:hypothetical protein